MSSTNEQPRPPEMIEVAFRHGSITAVGVITAFSLGFLTAWGANPMPWEFNDIFALVPIIAGVIFEIIAVAKLLDVRSLEMRRYKSAIRFFLTGMILVSVGVASALVVDFIAINRDHQVTTVPHEQMSAE